MVESNSSVESRGAIYMSKTVVMIVPVLIVGFMALTGCGTTTKHLSSTGAKESTVSVYELRASSNERFSPIIKNAMKHVTKTKMVLLAPTLPDYSPHETRENWYMGAFVQSSANNYLIGLQWTYRQLPINSPALSNPYYTNTGDAGIIGSFGGTQYPSTKAALTQLYRQQRGMASAYLSPPAKSKGATVDLGNGIQGLAYSSSFNPMVIWHQAKWTLEVTDTALPYDIQEAKKLVTYLHTHKLPPTKGVFGVNIAGDGDHTLAEWALGKVVYSCFDDHSGLEAAKMVVSMRVCRS